MPLGRCRGAGSRAGARGALLRRASWGWARVPEREAESGETLSQGKGARRLTPGSGRCSLSWGWRLRGRGLPPVLAAAWGPGGTSPCACPPTGRPQQSGHWAMVGAESGLIATSWEEAQRRGPRTGLQPRCCAAAQGLLGTRSPCQDPHDTGGVGAGRLI